MPCSFFWVLKDGLFSPVEKREGARVDESVGVLRAVCAAALLSRDVSSGVPPGEQ